MNNDKMEKYYRACAQPQSNYAVEHFIDGSQFTPERRFRQSVIELGVATDSYAEMQYLMAKQDIKIKKLKGKIFKLEKGTDEHTLAELKLERKLAKRVRNLSGLDGKRREIEQHEKNLAKVESELGFTEDTTDEEIYEILQKAEADYYMIKLAMDTAAHIINQRGGPSVGVSLSLQQMPKEDIARFNDTLNGMLQSMSLNQYTPAIHGEGDISQIIEKGIEVAAHQALTNKEER